MSRAHDLPRHPRPVIPFKEILSRMQEARRQGYARASLHLLPDGTYEYLFLGTLGVSADQRKQGIYPLPSLDYYLDDEDAQVYLQEYLDGRYRESLGLAPIEVIEMPDDTDKDLLDEHPSTAHQMIVKLNVEILCFGHRRPTEWAMLSARFFGQQQEGALLYALVGLCPECEEQLSQMLEGQAAVSDIERWLREQSR